MAAAAESESLSEAEAQTRLAAEGANELPKSRTRSVVDIVIESAREPMQMLMLGAAVLYLVLGDVLEGLFLVATASVAMGLVVLQEARSERALAALKSLAQPYARVIRDGVERAVAVRELVRDDLVLVGEGERMPADALLLSGDALTVDESMLTGESAPVAKRFAATGEAFTPEIAPTAETCAFLFAGTLIVRGQGVARVARTGARSALGKIGKALAEIEPEQTPLQKSAGRLVTFLGAIALGFCAFVAIAYGLVRHDWVGGALAGITFAIALIPEEFPMVLAVFLALGAWRLAAHRVLVRRSPVIEALGGATLLCVDKTGTLTENRMRVARLWSDTLDVMLDDVGAEAKGEGGELLRLARLASALYPVDPMDKALDQLIGAANIPTQDFERSWPLKPERMAFIQAWRSTDGFVLAAKGAPEAIITLCGLEPASRARLSDIVATFAQSGLRVLGVASALTTDRLDDPGAAPFCFRGLIGFVDPVRADARAALQEARRAGIKVAMITGDHPATALAIAGEAGIDVEAGALLGEEMARLPFPTLCEQLRKVRVFARITPEQKLLLVEAFKADGEIVAMTGDGVNDAPALEAAHIGIAMGKKGTDVAREAADLVLLDDSFASIVGGVRLGRRIFTNLRNALTYITAIHVPIAGLALAPILLNLPPLLFPMHVVLLELAIDPTCALVFEAERSDEKAMREPPRRRDEVLFGSYEVGLSVLQGAGLLFAVLGFYMFALDAGPERAARGAAFVALTLGNLAYALADSVSSGGVFAPHRRVYWAIVAAITAALVLVFAVPPFSAMFGVAAPPLRLLGWALALAAMSGAWALAVKRLGARLKARRAAVGAG
jgi:Ca2+-transporting ATPase